MSPFWSRDKAKIEKVGSASNAESGDALIIDQLRKAGADLTKPRAVNHYLYFARDAEDKARGVAEQYGKAGLGASVAQSADGKWSVRITHVIEVASSDFEEEKASIQRVAAALQAEYDGWEAAVESWEPPKA